MARREEERRGNMSIFQADPTLRWAILGKSRRDAEMASISNRNALAKATSLRGAHFGPICSPFRRLEGAGNGS
jgi:hypothetical protein